tara:strand:- start:42 stop:485 length:444 start_codon:yes stop_codon:yes gene_type:complete
MDNFDLKKFLGEKSLLNESAPGYDSRKFGEALPTLESVKAAYEAKECKCGKGETCKCNNIKSLDEQENARPDINSKTLLDLIARDLKFAGIYQNPEMLAYEEAVEIMDHVIGMTGEDYTGQTALLDYINDGEFEKGDKDIYIEPKRN